MACSLDRYNIPSRFDMLKPERWRSIIHRELLDVRSRVDDWVDHAYSMIDMRLKVYESLRDVSSVLELAIWKANILEQCGLVGGFDCTDQTKHACRVNCGAMFIIPHVLTYLVGDEGNSWREYEIGAEKKKASVDEYHWMKWDQRQRSNQKPVILIEPSTIQPGRVRWRRRVTLHTWSS